VTVAGPASKSRRTLELLPTRATEAYEEIKRQIIELDLAPGSVFTEADMAARLGLSKTPAREALARLNGEGLIHVVPRSGYRVAPVTLKMARDLFDLRAVLEAEALARAASKPIDIDVLRELETLRATTYRPADRESVRSFLKANTAFHVGLARAGGNDAIAEVLERVFNQLQRLFHLGVMLSSRADEVVHEHHEMLDAVMRGDPDLAREVARTQVANARRVILNALLSSDVILSANVVPATRPGDEWR
jgi:DNA-binding GntR family transcriptional regulator